ncbi:MAG TPA: acyl-CoA dehydrogenase family protein [Amycolatopsis sp.]|nr:acyl-CoA dehydrogenase family protein [Amycolatopsis sp.]
MSTDVLDELRTFLDEAVPRFRAEHGSDDTSWDTRVAWQRVMAAGGWAAPGWAPEHGGRGLPAHDVLAVEDVVASYGMPALPGMLGLKNVGPTLARWGNDEQKKSLPRILSADEVWCQGFSEPGAGSDLAGLRTRAVRDGNEFVVNGQKIWTSSGMRATHMELLVRTDPAAPKHRGISALLVDLSTPGIEVRPIRQINGQAEFAEVFFTDARVPAANLLGPENDGWTVTMTTLGHERSGVAIFATRFEREVREFIAANRSRDFSPVQRDTLVRHFIEARVVALLGEASLSRLAAGEQPGAEQSVIKLVWSEAAQRLSGTRLDLAGIEGVAGDQQDVAGGYLSARAQTIAAGTSPIVKNVLAERVLGLPRG